MYAAVWARYLQTTFGADLGERGVTLGYDHRGAGTLCSKGFADITARVLLSEGIPVHMLHTQARHHARTHAHVERPSALGRALHRWPHPLVPGWNCVHRLPPPSLLSESATRTVLLA